MFNLDFIINNRTNQKNVCLTLISLDFGGTHAQSVFNLDLMMNQRK